MAEHNAETVRVPTPLWDGLRSVLFKAFGSEMNGPWSAWATKTLTEEEIHALFSIGIMLKPGTTHIDGSRRASESDGGLADA